MTARARASYLEALMRKSLAILFTCAVASLSGCGGGERVGDDDGGDALGAAAEEQEPQEAEDGEDDDEDASEALNLR